MFTTLPNRSFIKSIILFIALFQLTVDGFSQKKQTYNLLWEITGKSLTKPSYVFGAASFKDRRVFNFSDSVMKAIQLSNAFVMENHPDSLTKLAFKQLSSIKGLKESISAEKAKIILDQFKIKHGYAADSSLLSNPFQIGDLMKPDYSRPDDMLSTVDNYLYGIARTLKKKILGFNKPPGSINYDDAVAEVEALLENTEEEELDFQGYEEMMAVFEAGNIDDILNFINANYESGVDFSDQNKEMANHIIAMLNNDGLFFAIGLENLAGSNGVIALLKKAGYEVRAVEATFTGVAKTYTIDYTKMDWPTYENKVDQFTVNFPSAPLTTSTIGSAKTVAYADATNGILYTVSSLFTGSLSNSTSEQYIDTVFNFHSKNEGFNVLSRKKYTKYGTTVLEVDFKKNGKYAKMVLVHHNQIYYTLAIESKINNLHEPFADLFFNSFKMTEPLVINTTEWITHEDKIGAFSLKIPVPAEGGQKEVPNPIYPDRPYAINMFSSSDKANQLNYIFRYNDFPAGMYLSDKKAVFDALTSNIEQNGKIIDQKRVIYKNGYEGRTLSAIVQGTYMEIQVYLRGNRIYLLLTQNMKGIEKPKNNIFFESFKFLPYSALNGELTTIGNMEITMPDVPMLSKPLTSNDKEDDKYTSFLGDSETISATNKNTGGAYGVEKSKVSKYYKTKNLDSIYNLLIDRLNPNTPKIKAIDLTIGNLKGKEVITKDSLANTSKKIRIWFQGDEFYFQTLISSADEIEKGEFATMFFNKTQVKNDQPLFNFSSSKAKLITQDLLSKDTLTYQKALGALSYYKFEKDELPIIYAALQQKYADDTASTGARASLLNELETLNDDKTTDVLKNLYQASNIDLIKGKILSIITAVNKDNYDWYLKSLIETPVLTLKNRWNLFMPLTDSISYAASHINQILPMLAVEEYRPMVLDIVATMLSEKNKANYQSLVADKKELIVKNALHDLEEDIKKLKTNQYSITAYNYLAILPVLDPKLTDEYTKKIFPLDSVPNLITEAFTARINANLPLDDQLLNAQLDSLTSRYRIMYAFNKVGKLASVPAKYKKPDEFAKLLMHGYLLDEYGEPSGLKYLGTVKDGKDTYFVFDFSYEEDGVTISYIGISRPFKALSQELDFDKNVAYSDFEPKSKDWMKQAKEMIKEVKEL